MTTLAIIALGFLLLASAGMLRHAIDHAPEGYEDEMGFHRGAEPALSAAAPAPLDEERSDPGFCDDVGPWPRKAGVAGASFTSNRRIATHAHGVP